MTAEGFVFAQTLVNSDVSTIADQEATVFLVLLLQVFVSFFSSAVITVLFTKTKVFRRGSAMTAHLSLELFGLWSQCCGVSAEGAVSSELVLKQCQACVWPGPCGGPAP